MTMKKMTSAFMSSRLWGLLAGLAAGVAAAQTPPSPPSEPPAETAETAEGRILPFSDEEVLRHILPPLPPEAPKPSGDPRNLEGTWVHDQPTVGRMGRDLYGKRVPLTPLGRRISDRRAAGSRGAEVPYTNAAAECRPPGQQWEMELYYPFQIYQTGKNVVFLFAFAHVVWNIRMDQQHLGVPQYMGDSVAHWDGNTLVVESANYKRGLWLDSNGTPTSTEARLTHRIRRIEQGVPKLEIVTTVNDPKMYETPWSFVRTFAWRPDKTIFAEYNCEYQAGAPDGMSRYGLAEEPKED